MSAISKIISDSVDGLLADDANIELVALEKVAKLARETNSLLNSTMTWMEEEGERLFKQNSMLPWHQWEKNILHGVNAGASQKEG